MTDLSDLLFHFRDYRLGKPNKVANTLPFWGLVIFRRLDKIYILLRMVLGKTKTHYSERNYYHVIRSQGKRSRSG